MIIALVGTLAFAAVWFTLLRPSTEEAVPAADTGAATQAPASAPGGGTSVTDAPAQAQAAADAADAASAQREAQADATAGDGAAATPGSSSSQSAAGDAGATGATGTDPPVKQVTIDPGVPKSEASILRQLGEGKVVVLLFWNASSADDRAARSAVDEATKGRGADVSVRIINEKRVGEYEAITGGVTVAQTPTTMIIGPERKAVTITGLVDPLEIEQAIGRMAPAKD